MPTPTDLPPFTYQQACDAIPLILANSTLYIDESNFDLPPHHQRLNNIVGILCPILQLLSIDPACRHCFTAAIRLGAVTHPLGALNTPTAPLIPFVQD